MYTIQSQILKQRRISLGYTKTDVAKHIGTSLQQYSKYESGLINIGKGQQFIFYSILISTGFPTILSTKRDSAIESKSSK